MVKLFCTLIACFIYMEGSLGSLVQGNYRDDFRSAVNDTDEWPSKYSKIFIEVRIPTQ